MTKTEYLQTKVLINSVLKTHMFLANCFVLATLLLGITLIAFQYIHPVKTFNFNLYSCGILLIIAMVYWSITGNKDAERVLLNQQLYLFWKKGISLEETLDKEIFKVLFKKPYKNVNVKLDYGNTNYHEYDILPEY